MDKDGWTIARWDGSYWKLLEAPGIWGPDAFVEIGERVERQSEEEFSAADQKVMRYLQKRFPAHSIIEARSRLDNGTVIELTHFTRWPHPLPITDAQKTGERFLVWVRSYWTTGVWTLGFMFNDGHPGYWTLKDGGHYAGSEQVTHCLPLPPDVKP